MPMPLYERRRRLATLLEEAGEGVWFSRHVEGEQDLKLVDVVSMAAGLPGPLHRAKGVEVRRGDAARRVAEAERRTGATPR